MDDDKNVQNEKERKIFLSFILHSSLLITHLHVILFFLLWFNLIQSSYLCFKNMWKKNNIKKFFLILTNGWLSINYAYTWSRMCIWFFWKSFFYIKFSFEIILFLLFMPAKYTSFLFDLSHQLNLFFSFYSLGLIFYFKETNFLKVKIV